MGFGPVYSPLTILLLAGSNFHFSSDIDPNPTNFSNIYFLEFGNVSFFYWYLASLVSPHLQDRLVMIFFTSTGFIRAKKKFRWPCFLPYWSVIPGPSGSEQWMRIRIRKTSILPQNFQPNDARLHMVGYISLCTAGPYCLRIPVSDRWALTANILYPFHCAGCQPRGHCATRSSWGSWCYWHKWGLFMLS